MSATLTFENHPNLDFPWVKNRKPVIITSRYKTLADAINAAKFIQRMRPTGEEYICDIVTTSGKTYSVSSNGRVWEGCSREWTTETVEVK